jgi:membrane-associated protease RseP (regulator of RpoE activity)
MSFRNKSILIVLALFLPGSLIAIQITGKVGAVSGDTATIAMDGDVLPSVGDKVDVFFKVGKAEVSVGSGKVTEATAGSVKARIDNATGNIAQDQFVRINSLAAKKRPAPTYLGVQISAAADGASGALAVEIIPNSPAVTAGFQVGDLIMAIDGSPVESPDQVTSTVTSMSPGTRHAFLVSREGKMKKLEATLLPRPSGLDATTATPSLRGDWIGSMTGNTRISFSFKDNNNLLWVVESPGSTTSTMAKYRLNTTVTPHVIEIFDFEEGEFKGQTIRGFFELQSDGRLKIDLSEKQERGFSDGETVLMSRAASPIVRPPSTSSPPKDVVAAATSPSPSATSSAPVDPTPDPSKPPDEQQIAIGDARYNRRDFDGAIEAYNGAIKLNPKNSWGYRDRGAALVQKDDYDGAIADYEKAIALDPKRWKDSLSDSIKDLKAVRQSKHQN